jgi:hypothetical protein
MADTSIKLHVLSNVGCHSRSLIDVVIILSGNSSLSELVSVNMLEGKMTTRFQEPLHAITISRRPTCLDQVLFVSGETSTVVSDNAVRITSIKSPVAHTEKAKFAADNIFCDRGVYF